MRRDRRRLIAQRVTVSLQLELHCSLLAALLFDRLIASADDEGRFTAAPGAVREACFPHRPEITVRKVAAALDELSAATDDDGVPLVCRYEVHGAKLLHLPKFAELQRGWLRRDRPGWREEYNPPARCVCANRVRREPPQLKEVTRAYPK